MLNKEDTAAQSAVNKIMNNNLDRDFNAFSLLKFTIPSILNLLFMSVYQMVDAIFIANCVGENALASINIVYPVISVVLAVTLMFSTGGSAIVAMNMGQGKNRTASENFTAITIVSALVAVVISLCSAIFMEPLLAFLGATPALLEDCRGYLNVLILFMPVAALQLVFLSFFIVSGKPGLGFVLTLLSGSVNIVLDYLFVAVLGWGVQGAALATAIGYMTAALPGLFYFLFKRKGTLLFVRPRFRLKVLGFSCFNGSSEMVSNLSISVTTLLFNKMALQYLGESGVAAITVALYSQFFLTAVFMGFTGGSGPVFSFQYGRQNAGGLNKLFRSSTLIVSVLTVLVVICAYVLARPIVSVFIRPSSSSYGLALHGFYLFSLGYLFAGINIYASGLFTALQNGKVSAVISFLRTFLFIAASLILLPLIIGADGIWLAVPVAELFSFLVSLCFLFAYRKKYFFIMKAAKAPSAQTPLA